MIIGRWITMSVLEIVLYSVIGLAVLIYLIHSIRQIVKNKKKQENGEKPNDKDKDD